MDRPTVTSIRRSKPPEAPPRPSGSELGEIAARWRGFRVLYPIYAELSRRFQLGSTCDYLDSPINRSEPEVLQAVEAWFAAVDQRSEAWQLRQLLQVTSLGSEEAIGALATHYLSKPDKTGQDRDKIDFLLVQLLDLQAPHSLPAGGLELEDVARILEPLLGEASTVPPAWMSPLDEALAELEQCHSLRDLLERRLIERVRAMKEEAGQMFYGSAVLLAFTRFNFHMRRAFFRCLSDDLQAIRQQLQDLKRGGVETVDCTGAHLSANEPLESIRELCAHWKQPFGAPYAAGHSFEQLVEIRAAVQAARDALEAAAGAVDTASAALSTSERLL